MSGDTTPDAVDRAGVPAGAALVALAAMLWATAGAASKMLYGVADVPPLVIGFFRLALAVPLLAGWCWWRLGPATFHFPGRDLPRIVALGAAMAVYQVFFFAAVPEIGVALTALVTVCSAPVLVGVAAIFVLGEAFTRRLGAALVFGLAGAGLLVGMPSNAGNPFGILLAAVAAVAFAAFVICSRTLAHHDPGKIIVVGFGSGAIFIAPFALGAGMPAGAWSAPVWAALIYIGLIPTALAYLLYFRGIRSTTATAASVLALAEPLTATMLGWAIFGETLGLPAMLGAVLLLIAMATLLRAGSGSKP